MLIYNTEHAHIRNVKHIQCITFWQQLHVFITEKIDLEKLHHSTVQEILPNVLGQQCMLVERLSSRFWGCIQKCIKAR